MTRLSRARGLAGRAVRRASWRSTSDYWNRHYAAGHNSGAGSFGRLASFKAATLNALVDEFDVASVVELGCGDGNQLRLAEYRAYLGLDVARDALRQSIATFSDDSTKSFMLYDPEFWVNNSALVFDAAISLDVIFHLVEDSTFHSHMEHLFQLASQLVIIYSSNHEEPHKEPYMRHHHLSAWVESNRPEWRLVRTIPNLYPYNDAAPNDTSYSDFFVFTREDVGAAQAGLTT